jgi:hypothetical protein
LPHFFLFNSGAESFRNSSVSALSLLLFALVQNYKFAFRDCNGKWMLPFVNAIATLLHCVYHMHSHIHITFYWTFANI